MPAQTDYYNLFGSKYRDAILSCPEPQFWTTDYESRGRVYTEMKERVEAQERLISAYFNPALPVLDIGCGFGRQAFLLAKKGFQISGTDTSEVFIEIARTLFHRHGLKGNFMQMDLLEDKPGESFGQVMLLDVLEHIPPMRRKNFMLKIYALMPKDGQLLISLPHMKERLSSQLNNRFRRGLTQYLPYFRNREEHPYPIPGPGQLAEMMKDHFVLVHRERIGPTNYYLMKKS